MLVSNTVSVIICTRNRARSLAGTLDSISRLDVPPRMSVEIVVVDNGSTDDTPMVIRGASHGDIPVRYISEPIPGKSRALNRSIEVTDSEILLWTDDDVRVRPDWLTKMVAPILSGEADACAGGVKLAAHLIQPWMTASHKSWYASFDRLTFERQPSMIGANMAVSRRVIRSIPSYDPELGPPGTGSGEETLFSRQLLTAGFKLLFVDDADVEHHFDMARLHPKHQIRAAIAFGRSNAYMCHHWHHNTIPNARWHTVKIGVLVKIEELSRWWRSANNLSEREMGLRCYLHLCREYLIIRHQPKKYERRGLRKLVP